LKPWLIGARSPTARRQVLRQAVVVTRVDQQGQLAVQQVGEVGDRRLQRVHRDRDVAAVEVAAVQHQLGVPSMSGLSLALLSSFSMSRASRAARRASTPMTCGAQRIE
jgi:hypothetical protein